LALIPMAAEMASIAGIATALDVSVRRGTTAATKATVAAVRSTERAGPAGAATTAEIA
jgi:hypothetical protein